MRRILFVLMVLVASGLLPVAAQTPGYGLLVVGDGSNPAAVKVEKAIKARVQQDLAQASVDNEKLPLMSYHLDNARERKYCEGKLGITATEVPLVAVVQQSNYAPTKVVARVDHVSNAEQAADDMVRKAGVTLVADAPTKTPPAKKTVTESELIYEYYLKNPDKLGFSPDEGTLHEVMSEVKAKYVDPVTDQSLLGGIIPEVKALLKEAKLSDAALSGLAVNNDLPSKVHDLYGSKVNGSLLWFAEIRGVLTSLKDPYTVLMTPPEYKTLNEQMQNETFGGIGIYIELDPDNHHQLTVVEPIEDTPAYKAGLQPGDQIMKINGTLTEGLNIDVATNKIRGPVGSQVVLTIKRKGLTSTKDFTLVRANIKVKSVTSKMLPGGIGYVRLRVFGADTANEVENAIEVCKTKGMKALVLDVRNNGGGYITAAQSICSLFVKPGETVVSTVERGGKKEDMPSVGPGNYSFPTVLLVNQFSASASEITAGCLKDHKVATLIGVKTFGKGSVQQIFPFQNGSVLKCTIAHFFSPEGHPINHVGIIPDIEVKMEAKDVGKANDVQLKKAEDFLAQKLGGK